MSQIQQHVSIESDEPPPGLEKRSARVHGGPLDGSTLMFHQAFKPWAGQEIDVPVETDEGIVGEPYMLVPLYGTGDQIVQWDAVWLTWYRPGIRAERDPEVALLRQSHASFGFKLLTEPCQPGEHDWNPWVSTPRGNRTRSCTRCKVSQGSVL